jgi:hypothetical protein
MAVAALEAPVEEPNVAELSDDTHREILELREGGMTLAELKLRFPQLTGEQIRSLLPPGNARERKQRERKPKATVAEVTKGVGGRSGSKKSDTPKKQSAKKAEAPKAEEPKYVDDAELSARVLIVRQVVGRAKLAELLGISQSATWRAERDRVTPDEAGPLRTALAQVEERVAKGEFVKAPRQTKAAAPKKADLLAQREQVLHLVETARESKSVGTIHELLDKALAVLNPTDALTA